MHSFDQALSVGKTGESQIAQWLKEKGSHVLPIYEIADNQYKGPALYAAGGETIIAPDMAVFNKNGVTFIEAKHKNAFSWHRISKSWVTGIDLHHYQEYRNFQEKVGHQVWVLFLHCGGTAKDSTQSPSGLFGNSLSCLVKKENHRSNKWGKNGMVYWDIDDLIKLSNYPLFY